MRFAQSAVSVLIVGILTPALAQQDQTVITLERTTCFGSCPAYVLRVAASGAVTFTPNSFTPNREERTASITPNQLHGIVAAFDAIHFFDLKDDYPPIHTDGQTTYIGLTLEGKAKRIKHFDNGPAELRELERTIELVTNTHRWLRGDPRNYTLQSPVAGSQMGGGEDLKNERFVGEDVYTGIKPGMNSLMRAAGQGDLAEIRRAQSQGEDVNAADETGWTALMIAAEAAGTLVAHGASVEATNDLGESPLMWAARAGNPESIAVLLRAGANAARVDRSGHTAAFYLRGARDVLTFDPTVAERYRRAESVLEQK